jgi:hypothetical protein
VPLRRYEDFWREYWQQPFPMLVDVTWPGIIPYFAVTSGTTSGTSKYIPVTQEMNRSNSRASFDILVHHLAHRPKSRPLDGKVFMLGGSTDLVQQAPTVYSGDLSGIAVKRLPGLLRAFTFPPPAIAREKDFEKKVERIAQLVPYTRIRVVGGTPSWLLLLFDRQQALFGRPATARELYPELELLVHGGVNFKPYRARFEAFLAGGAELREVYPASEGFIALQDESPGDGLRLMTDNGLFFEFVPVEELGDANPTRHTLANVQLDVNYAVVVSTCAGCWAYVIGDTVRFLSRIPPRIVVTGRTSYFLSAFGEHLIGEEIEDAVAAAARKLGGELRDFCVGPLIPARAGENARHLYVVEFTNGDMSRMPEFAAAVDAYLVRRNDDYRAHRADGSLAKPEALPVPPGSFAAWMKARGRMGAQNKVPRVINDADLFRQLLSFVRDHVARGDSPA